MYLINVLAEQSVQMCIYNNKRWESCSRVHNIMGTLCDFRLDSWVRSNACLWLCESITMSCWELFFVVWASISNYDLGGVFVWHNDSGAWKSTPVGIWMVSLKWFLDHTCMQVWSNLESVLRHGCNFWWTIGPWISWSIILWCTETYAHILSILHQYSWSRCNSSILEVLIGLEHLLLMELFSHLIILKSLRLKFLTSLLLGQISSSLNHFFFLSIIYLDYL